MPLQIRTIISLVALTTVAHAAPDPGRIPKVYNALITSSQNLSPSKAFPVYQPLVQQFGYPYLGSPYFGPQFDFAQMPQQGIKPIVVQQNIPEITDKQGTADNGDGQNQGNSNSPPTNDGRGQQSQTPPTTESPIPLNEFGLPPNVLPLGKFNPDTQFPSPYDPFAINPYLQTNPYDFNPYYFNFDQNPYGGLPPIYKFPGQELETPLDISLGTPNTERRSDDNKKSKDEKKRENDGTEMKAEANSTPPPAPTDLDVNNNNKKDPNIPDVPPPPLPQGGLKQQ